MFCRFRFAEKVIQIFVTVVCAERAKRLNSKQHQNNWDQCLFQIASCGTFTQEINFFDCTHTTSLSDKNGTKITKRGLRFSAHGEKRRLLCSERIVHVEVKVYVEWMSGVFSRSMKMIWFGF